MKKKIDEEKLLSIIYANYSDKGKKIHDRVYLAKILKKLRKHYKSSKKLAGLSDLSGETIREALKILELPKEIQNLLEEEKLKQEVAWRIASVKGTKNQIRVANAVIGLNTHDARDVVRLFRNNPKFNVEDYVKKIRESKSRKEEINLIIVPLRKSDYDLIKKIAISKNKSVNKFILEDLVQKFLKGVK